MSASDIAVIGLACRFPGARNPEQFWANLRDGVESVTSFSDEELVAAGVPRALLDDPQYVKAGVLFEDLPLFDAGFFGFNPQEAAILDPQHRHFLECCWEALENAGYVPERYSGAIGVYAGSGMNGYLMFNLLSNPELIDSLGLFLVRHTGNDKDFLATRVSYCLNLTGPSISVQSACSTSLVAVHVASQSLLNRECDICLAGGVTIEMPHGRGYLYREGEILSPDGHCRAFDAEARGTILGSGAGVVVLKRLDDALADGDHVHAVIRGSAVNNDGATKVGYFAPSVTGQSHAVAEAILVSEVPVDTITYLEAHGTGTVVGDPIEVAALTQAFRDGTDASGFCALGAVKPNIGHLDTASGIAGLIKTIEALKHRQLPPTLHFEAPNPAIDFASTPFFVNGGLRDWPTDGAPRRAGVNSLGVGGTNAFVVLEEAPEPEPGCAARPWQLLLLSARSESALDAATANLADHLTTAADDDLPDIAYTLQVGRRAFPYRRAVVCANRREALSALDGREPHQVHDARATGKPGVAFMFAGGGAQYPNMARELYEVEPVFRAEIDRCLGLCGPGVGPEVRAALFPSPGHEEEAARQLARPSLALPALFAIQYAQARLWRSWGIEPAALIGHSMGEYTAACLAGVFSLEDAIGVVVLRGRLFEAVAPGAMLSVHSPAEDLEPLLEQAVSIAAVNAPALCVAAGPVDAIGALEDVLHRGEIEYRRVHISVAAHSALVEPILDEFGAHVAGLPLHPASIPLVSNLSGTWLTDAEATDPGYWVRHLRETVRFADGIATVLAEPNRVLLEVGPGRTLATLARQHTAAERRTVLTSLPHPGEEGSDVGFMLGTLGRLWTAGVSFDSAAFHAGQERRRVPLPTYPFEHKRYWIEPGTPARGEPAGPAATPARTPIDEWFYVPGWKPTGPPAPAQESGTGSFLVFAGEDGLGERVAKTLRARGRVVSVVAAGTRFEARSGNEYRVRPGAAEDYDRLLAAVSAEGPIPSEILHVWNVGPGSSDPGEGIDRAFLSLVHLVQAVGCRDLVEPLRILCVTSGAQQVAGEDVPAPARALVQGLLATVPAEYPNIRCQWIDVATGQPETWQDTLLVDQLLAELSADPADAVIAYRGHARLTRTFDRISLPTGARAGTPLRHNGTYLITGGLGGIGLTMAEELARTAPCRLILLGRTPLPPREQWTEYLRRTPAGDQVARKLRRLQAIEAHGAEAVPVTGDVTDRVRMKALLADLGHRFGPVHGVVHAAGVLNDGPLQVRTRDELDAMLAAKVRGALLLDELLDPESLDFFLLCSSQSAFAGLPGQADYGAANAFLDAFARHRAFRRPGLTVSIGWGPWRDVGMIAELSARAPSRTAAPGGRRLSHPLVQRCVEETDQRAVYSAPLSVGEHWVVREHRVRGGEAVVPGAGFLELARGALIDRFGDVAFELRDVLFLAPAFLSDSEPREFVIRLERENGGSVFAIASRTEGAPETVHARGEYARLVDPPPSTRHVGDLLRRCRPANGATAAAACHLEFGHRWDALKQVCLGTDEAVVELQLPEDCASDLPDFGLHPALLDLATAGALSLSGATAPPNEFFVPVAYGSLRQWRPLPRAAFSHVRRVIPGPAGSFDQDPSYITLDVTILDQSGNVVVDIAGFTMKRVSLDVLHPPPTAGAFDRRLEQVLRDAIRPDEGATVFRRILEVPAGPQIIVSPVPLLERLAGMRPQPAVARKKKSAPGPDLSRAIEVLRAHEAVLDAGVTSRVDSSGEPRVVAYILPHPALGATVSELRRYARRNLPADLVPSLFIDVDELPRTAGGLVDYAGLPDPFGTAEVRAAPASDTERLLAAIWQEALGVESVGLHDNFLDLGGHSLLAIRVVTRLQKKTGVRLAPGMLAVQTLGQIAAHCESQLRMVTNAPDA